MSRPLRVEYPGAWYHVMNRGRRSDRIFELRNDYLMFIDLLKDATELWDISEKKGSGLHRLLLKAVFEMGLLSIANDTDEIPVETEKFPTAPKSHGELTNKPGK